MSKLGMYLYIEAVATSPYLTSQVATYGGTFCSLIYGVAFHDLMNKGGTFCSLIYEVAFHDLMNKGGNVSFSPYLDQLIKGVVFPYSLLYMTK